MRTIVHRHADVCLGQGRGIVGAVAAHRNQASVVLLVTDARQFFLRRSFGQHVVHARFSSNRRSGQRVVAGDHDRADPQFAQFGETLADAGLDHVLEMDRTEQFTVDADQQRGAAALGDLVDFTGQRCGEIGASEAHKGQQRIHRAFAIHAPLIVDTGQTCLCAERYGGQQLGGRFGLWLGSTQVLDDGLAFCRVISQRSKQRTLGQFPGSDARRGIDRGATTVTEGDGAGLVQQQDVHVPRRFHGAAGFGDHVQAHQAIHPGDTNR
ncbi:hypothetical protein D3C87_1297780 [compost metagenome]